jgi:hypothetical protein
MVSRPCAFLHSLTILRRPFIFVVKNRLRKYKGSIWGGLALLTVAGTLALNIVATVLLTRASMANYPGGTALALLNKRYANSEHGRPTLLRNAPIGQLIERFAYSARSHLKPRRAKRRVTLPPYSRSALPRALGCPSARSLCRLSPMDLQQD